MADKKITQLTNITGANLAEADEFVVVDITADETKAITFSELKTAFDTGTGFVRITGDTMTGALTTTGLTVTSGSSSDNIMQVFGGGTIYAGLGVDGTGAILTAGSSGSADSDLIIKTSTGGTEVQRARFQDNGDISFYEDTGTTPKFFWDASAESLGIGQGVFSGTQALNIKGEGIAIKNDKSGSNNNWSLIRNTGTSSTSNVSFVTGAGEAMVLAHNKNVGIGTSSPSGKLSIEGGTATGEKSHITFENTSGAKKFAIGGGKSGVTNNGFAVVNVTDNTAPLLIDDSGNVGIGISSLVNPLMVKVTSNTANKTTGSAFDGAAIRLNGELGPSTNSEIAILAGLNDTLSAGIGFLRENSSTWGTALKFYTRPSATTGGTDDIAERMRIASNGDILAKTIDARIGSDVGAVEYGTSTGNSVRFYSDDTERMRINSLGNVGIGESSPLGKLHVKNGDSGASADSGANELVIENNTHSGITILSGQSYNGSIYFGDSGVNYDGFVTYGQGTRSMAFGTAAGTRMTIDSSGNVGIGVNNPAALLEVEGSRNDNWAGRFENTNTGGYGVLAVTAASTSNDRAFEVRKNTSDVAMMILGDGNVGIGEDNPSAPLVVNATASSEGLRVQRNGVSSQYISIHQATGGDHVIETFGNKALNFGVRDAQPITFKTNNTERMRIDASGNLLVGETSNFIATSTSATGLALTQDGRFTLSRSAGTPMNVNKIGADGELIDFWKTGGHVGSIGSDFGYLTIGDASCRLLFLDSTPSIIPRGATNTGSNGAISLGDSGSRFKDLYLSGGVDFGGAVNSGGVVSSSNKLDDYEIGTWTPAVGTGSLTSGNQWYIKVGDMVTVSANVYNFSDRSSSNNVQITGLPFTSGNKTAVGSFMGSNISSSVGYSCYIAANESQVYFYEAPNAGNYETMKHNDLQTNADFYFNITYRV